MSVNSVLMDFSIDAQRISDESSRKDITKSIIENLSKYFENLSFVYEMLCDDGSMSILSDKTGTILTIRYFIEGLITINIEYYKKEGAQAKISFETLKDLHSIIRSMLNCKRSKLMPPICRGAEIDVYLTSSDERIIEYDIDKVHFDKRSDFQKIQIVHSKTLGNMLILDELQNIAEADLVYTETLMQRGKENYEGKEICILGGGDGALLYELLKEKPKHVVMLEIDDLVMEACNKYMPSICGDVLEVRKGGDYEIIVGDCMVYLNKYIKEGRKFDYVFGDLTDIPISDTPTGEIWDFILLMKITILGNGASCPESLEMYEAQLKKLNPPVKYTKDTAFVPSFMEDWIFYQVIVEN
ncbi:unnamed protein product [Diamesa hyperborea]